MYTGKVFVTAGRGDDAGRRESREAASQGSSDVTPRVAGSGYDRLGNKYKSARAFKHRAQLTRAAAVSPHMHVKDYITARDT